VSIFDANRRAAAVIMPIFATPPHGVLFVERAAHLRHHPGQIGLPGGTLDPQDLGDLERGALRELEEEVGIEAGRVTLVGRLPTVQPRVNMFDVTPFVAVIAPGELRIDPSETAGFFTVPLKTILSDALRDGHVSIAGFEIETPLLDYEGRRIWGVTGRILRDFVEAWNDAETGLRARVEGALSSIA
jgi:8-oxo-dGTP pyrophosphatase MutT (NUDIX family)